VKVMDMNRKIGVSLFIGGTHFVFILILAELGQAF
jgi:hypothetical protein